jgi:uncharacterized membrane protein
LNAEINPICHLLALLGAHHILHVSRISVKSAFQTFSSLYCNFNTSISSSNTLNAEINHICHLLALLGAHHILHVSRIWVKSACQTFYSLYCNCNTSISSSNTLNAEINHICHLLALLGAHHILHVSRMWVKSACQTFSSLYCNCNTSISSSNPLNAEINHICHLLALLGAHHILHVSRIRVNFHLFIKIYNDFHVLFQTTMFI